MKKMLKWGAVSAAVVVVLLLAAFGVTYATTQSAIDETLQVEVAEVKVPADAESIARGKRLIAIRGCVDCHGSDYGGKIVIDDPAMGTLVGTNLTGGEGGVAADYTDADWVRGIRHGLGKKGRKLVFMPSHEYARIDDRDLGQMIAYMKSLPAVDRDLGQTEIGPMMRVLAATGQLVLLPADRIDHSKRPEQAPPVAPTVEYGEYVAMTCTGCHGETFSGGPVPGTPPDWLPAANITPHKETGIGNWSKDDFFMALRDGVRPDGTKLDTKFMPVAMTAQMTDVETEALYKYLMTVPAKEEGGR